MEHPFDRFDKLTAGKLRASQGVNCGFKKGAGHGFLKQQVTAGLRINYITQ